MTQAHRLLLQLRGTVSADGLHKIRRNSHQQTHFFLKSPSLVLLLQRAVVCGSGGLVRFLLVSFPRANKTLSLLRVTFCGNRINPNMDEPAIFVKKDEFFHPLLALFPRFSPLNARFNATTCCYILLPHGS
jgi:hypothetical protein